MFKFFKKLIKGLFIFLKSFFRYYLWVLCKFFDFFKFQHSKLDLARKKISDEDLKKYSIIHRKFLTDGFFTFLKSNSFIIFDCFYSLYNSYRFGNVNFNLFRSYYRVVGSNLSFYFSFKKFFDNYNFIESVKNIFLVGLKSIWSGLRFWILPLVVIFMIIYYSMVIRCLPFNKVIFVWVAVGMVTYWLISGFVYFIKKNQFGKYTTAIQRFWRRSYILFWLIELSLFSVFIYLTLNANQESYYMFDQIQVYKTHLYSWRSFLPKLFQLTLLLLISYFFLLSLKWNVFNKHIYYMLIITVLLLYIIWFEFYQFFHVVNFYGNINWIYDVDDKVWSLELEPRKTRTVNHYVMLMMILKFWHIVFIFLFWVFFILRTIEIGRVRYPLLSANLQNFLILYLFLWVMMYPWFKFLFRRYLDTTYYWFYLNNRDLFSRVLFNDLNLAYYGLIDFIKTQRTNLYNHYSWSFFYWYNSDGESVYSYRKAFIKYKILSALNK